MPEKLNFPAEEEKTLERWNEIDAFGESLKRSEGMLHADFTRLAWVSVLSAGKPEYSFYDGPPFATGLPHYGHLLAGTIKV